MWEAGLFQFQTCLSVQRPGRECLTLTSVKLYVADTILSVLYGLHINPHKHIIFWYCQSSLSTHFMDGGLNYPVRVRNVLKVTELGVLEQALNPGNLAPDPPHVTATQCHVCFPCADPHRSDGRKPWFLPASPRCVLPAVCSWLCCQSTFSHLPTTTTPQSSILICFITSPGQPLSMMLSWLLAALVHVINTATIRSEIGQVTTEVVIVCIRLGTGN